MQGLATRWIITLNKFHSKNSLGEPNGDPQVKYIYIYLIKKYLTELKSEYPHLQNVSIFSQPVVKNEKKINDATNTININNALINTNEKNFKAKDRKKKRVRCRGLIKKKINLETNTYITFRNDMIRPWRLAWIK